MQDSNRQRTPGHLLYECLFFVDGKWTQLPWEIVYVSRRETWEKAALHFLRQSANQSWYKKAVKGETDTKS